MIGSEETSRSRRLNGHGSLLWWSVVAAATVVGGVLRLQAATRSLWLDEAWVANAVLEPTLHAAWFYDAWAQTEPPLFIALTRIVTRVFGADELTFRFVPIISGIGAIPLLALLAKRFLSLSLALAATLTFAFDPDLIVLSQAAKQYSPSILSTILVLLACCRFVERRDRGSLLVATGTIVALGGFSYQSFTFVPSLLVLLLAGPLRPYAEPGSRRAAWKAWSHPPLMWVVGVASVCALAAAGLYLGFVAPNSSGELLEYWSNWYPDWSHPATMLSLYGRTLTQLSEFVFTPGPVVSIAAVLALIGWVWPSDRALPEPWTRGRVRILLFGPVLVTVALNVAHAYPLGRYRLTAFLVPVSIMGFWLGVSTLGEWLVDRGRALIPRWSASHTKRMLDFGILGFVTAALIARTSWATPSAWTGHHPPEDPRAAASYLASVQDAGDVLYVHGSMWEQIRLYGRFHDLSAARLVKGRIGWPCCQHDDMWRDPPVSGALVEKELERIPLPRSSGTLRLVFTARQAHWNDYPDRGPARFERELRRRGCERGDVVEFRGVRVDEYRCGPEIRGSG